jgi:hypothetical protein
LTLHRSRQAPAAQGVDTHIPPYRDPAVLLTDQLKEVFVDGELEIVETAS